MQVDSLNTPHGKAATSRLSGELAARVCAALQPWPIALLMALLNIPASANAELLGERLSDAGYRTACGPIACFVALRSVGMDASLDELVERCGWREGDYTSLQTLHNALIASGVESRPVRLSPTKLAEILAQGTHVAILPVRKFTADIDHAVCATKADGDFICLVDYPQLGQWRHCDDLAKSWDGEAIVVSTNPSQWGLGRLLLSWAPGACAGLVGMWIISRAAHRPHLNVGSIIEGD